MPVVFSTIIQSPEVGSKMMGSDGPNSNVSMRRSQLDKILEAQKLQSEIFGDKVHDEHLFIITHQGMLILYHQLNRGLLYK